MASLAAGTASRANAAAAADNTPPSPPRLRGSQKVAIDRSIFRRLRHKDGSQSPYGRDLLLPGRRGGPRLEEAFAQSMESVRSAGESASATDAEGVSLEHLEPTAATSAHRDRAYGSRHDSSFQKEVPRQVFLNSSRELTAEELVTGAGGFEGLPSQRSRGRSSQRISSASVSRRPASARSQRDEDARRSGTPQPHRASFSATWTPSPARRPSRSDPVSRGAQMRALWSQDRFLTNTGTRKFDLRGCGGDSRSLCSRKAQLGDARGPVVPVYVPPHEKRRDSLRMQVRQQMLSTNGTSAWQEVR